MAEIDRRICRRKKFAAGGGDACGQSRKGRAGYASRGWQGSYTVEAAVLFSLTFLVLAALLICMFYCHDRAVSQSAACEAAVSAGNFAKAEQRREAADAVRAQVRAERFLGSRNVAGQAAIGEREVSAQWQGEYPVPGFAARYLSGGSLSVSRSWRCTVLDPADTIRKIKGLGDLLTKETG